MIIQTLYLCYSGFMWWSDSRSIDDGHFIWLQHLIKREGVLIVVDDGTSGGGEGEADQAAAAIERRILAVNPNYVLE